MTPFWIIDFVKKGSAESFFTTYWDSLSQNDRNFRQERWFHVTDGTAPEFSIETALETARQLTVDTRKGNIVRKKLIPAAANNPKILNVIMLGDITNEPTQKYMHKVAARLREESLGNATWCNAGMINFYAILWRPSDAAVTPGLESGAKAFLNELESLMRLDINRNPFHKILLFESSIIEEQKNDTFEAMNLAAYHIAMHRTSNGHDILCSKEDAPIVNAGIAGVFYEKEVQKEQEAFYLSTMLLDSFLNSESEEFLNVAEANRYVEDNGDFLSLLTPESVQNSIKENCPIPPGDRKSYGVEPEVSPYSMKFKEVWNKYYCTYLVNLKKDLVNKTKKQIWSFAESYRFTMQQTQAKFIKEKCKALEEKVFAIFKQPQDFKAVGIKQAIKILETFRKKINEQAKEIESTQFNSFNIPPYLKDACEQVRAEVGNGNENEVLEVLEGKLRNHPIFLLSMIVRVILIGVMLSAFITLFNGSPVDSTLIGTIVFVLLIVAALVWFNGYLVRIKALKDQYTACVLLKTKKQLDSELKTVTENTMRELDEYCDWLEKRKLRLIQKEFKATEPTRFSFEESRYFQPILKCDIQQSRLAVPDSRANGNCEKISLSGTFGNHDLLNHPPVNKVEIDGNDVLLKEIIKDTKQGYKRKLIGEMLKSQATVVNTIVEDVEFRSTNSIETKLLLLDVSGSMSGQALIDLKNAVERLSATARIKWVAFNNDVIAEGEGAEGIDKITASGGTCYIPAINRAEEIINEERIDQIILISDGEPFEDSEKIVNEAYKLNMPVSTISIGNSGAAVMAYISGKTSGVQVIVDNLEEFSNIIETKMEYVFRMGDDGEFAMGDLLQRCYIGGCRRALYNYAIGRSKTGNISIVDLLSGYMNEQAKQEWGKAAEPVCTYAPAGIQREEHTYLLTTSGRLDDNLTRTLQQCFSSDIKAHSLEEHPELIVLMLKLRKIEWRDLSWANYDESNRDFNDKDIEQYLLNNRGRKVNIYGNNIR